MEIAIIAHDNKKRELINKIDNLTKEEIKIVIVVTRKNESIQIFRIINEIDPNAFISQSSVIGVYGKGF